MNRYNSTLTVTNTGGSMISGPISVGLVGLTPGVTLNNSNGTFNGAPFITVTGNTMNPGDSANVLMLFSNPSNLRIIFSPTTYSGTMPPSALGVGCPASAVTRSTPHSSALMGSGGVLAYTYSITGSLPHNLNLNTATGAITGTPDTTGTSNFTAMVTDSAGGTPGTGDARGSNTGDTATQAPAINSGSSTER